MGPARAKIPPKKFQRKPAARSKGRQWSFKRILWRVGLWIGVAILGYLMLCSFCLLLLRWMDPWFTGVQAQRRVESWFDKRPYQKRRTQVPITRISAQLQHAAVASEDARFYKHHGIDWETIGKLVEEDFGEGKITRGGSTITQQLMKNLFATTHRNVARKGLEFALAPVAESILSKERILELYLNNIEWGRGVFGAEAAARFYYSIPAAQLSKEQAARLAVCIPSPLRRKPSRMGEAAGIIEARMQQMGW